MTDPASLIRRLLIVLGEDYVGTPIEVEAQAFLATHSKPTTRPTVMEIVALGDEIEEEGLGQVDLVRRALARWGCQSHAPIPLTDRHPTEADCDTDGFCWFWDYGWSMQHGQVFDDDCTHWLPHDALPTPKVD